MIFVAAFIVAFVLIVIFANRETRNCRWREDRSLDAGEGRAYRCMTCGAQTHTTTGLPPQICKAGDKRV